MEQQERTTPKDLPNYLLQINIWGIAAPYITRTLSVPATATFHTLHNAIQIAFDWRDCHLHSFEIFDITPAANEKREHGILSPRPPALLSLTPDPELDEEEGLETESSKKWKLLDIFENERFKNKAIEYLYDFGDHWMHSVTLVGHALGSTKYIACLSGEGSPVAEDAGGSYGFEELKAIYDRLRGGSNEFEDEEQQKMEWYEDSCPNGNRSGLQPWLWDREAVNKNLQRVKV